MTEQIDIMLGLRLMPLNTMLRTHWSKKRKLIQELAWEVRALIGHRQQPAEPWPRVSVLVERYSTQEPDEENLDSCVKFLMDVLQPFHPTLRPYGLGVIKEDNKKCVAKREVLHVQSRLKQTRVVITRLPDEPE